MSSHLKLLSRRSYPLMRFNGPQNSSAATKAVVSIYISLSSVSPVSRLRWWLVPVVHIPIAL